MGLVVVVDGFGGGGQVWWWRTGFTVCLSTVKLKWTNTQNNSCYPHSTIVLAIIYIDFQLLKLKTPFVSLVLQWYIQQFVNLVTWANMGQHGATWGNMGQHGLFNAWFI
jgi:hypothetical protein